MKNRTKSKASPLASGTGLQFWLIDTESPGENEWSFSASGPFDSLTAAEKHLRDDCRDCYLSADKSLRDCEEAGEWAAPVHIVKVIKTVRPQPEANVTVKLKTVNA